MLVILTVISVSIGSDLYAGHAARAQEYRYVEVTEGSEAAEESDAATRAAMAELRALDDAWIEAEIGRDRAALERILHEDFLATFGSGRTVDRDGFIEMVMSNDIPPFTVTLDYFRVFGDTAVVVERNGNGKTKYTWVAIKRDGQWRVIAETFNRIEQR